MEKDFHKYLLRIPNSLKENLLAQAKKENRSLGNYIINVLSTHVNALYSTNEENKK